MRKKLRDTAVIIGWASTIMLLTVRVLYQFNPEHSIIGSYLGLPDLLAILAVSVIAGIFLGDLDRVLLGYVVSIVSSILMALIFTSLFDWFFKGAERVFSDIPFGWEYVIFFAFSKIIRTMFPGAILLTFVGGFLGGILGDRVWPHRSF